MTRLLRITVALLVVGLAGLAAYRYWPRVVVDPVPAGPAVVWVFEAPRAGGIVAAPWVADDAIYVAAFHPHGFRMTGAVYALDPATGKKRWEFNAGGRMLATASAPVLADGRLYVGEGMHGHFACHLYCLDPTTGEQHWAVETTDHVESTATVADGVVYFGAGNDGVYAVDAATGDERWRFSGDLHIDARPCASNGRVIVGSGPSRRYKTLRVVSLDAKTGSPAWRIDTDLPAWGSPRAAGGRVFVGLGNGRLMEGAKPPETPRGAVLCLDEATGEQRWRFDAKDAVFQQPTVDGGRVYFGSRDGNLYCVEAGDGTEVYRVTMGGPVIAPPTVADSKVYAVTVGGTLRCLDAASGRELWAWDLKALVKFEPLVFAAVRVSGGRVYVACEVQTGAGGSACVYCLEP
jgi:outer membrane protein assembly factor BamB